MILLFEKQFIEPIQKGIKIHTLREDIHNRWHQGKLIHYKAWSGKGYRSPMIDIIKPSNVISKQHVFMSTYQGRLDISIASKELFGWSERNEFAINEGFVSWEAFEDYFYDMVDKREDSCYSPKLIHWTDKRY
ncbi:hypothetical protein [Saccharicrinis fermentans]|uniref:ASCH domain-containing protein n=1 Tax=Saccharicrinis fermentans DSM 9555 = JCM 21142 TaxID=869213 RepID=W7YEY6_9BACT|nr:hypothetical protein [Saccharicrinis fermentans]GAF06043.1 hypothetical protein JCM21142_134811 [Saccharicrinis fermentans DSM 9555 = JCM 21142]